MAKIQTISGLFAHTCEQVTNSPAAWRDFLTTAARFYKAYDRWRSPAVCATVLRKQSAGYGAIPVSAAILAGKRKV